ncbi:MAG TPA: aminotransferase class I/II-fold pyridoxal phosphate-dependent enzyme [Candidatus Baltobacteraceae bacterium]|nr:aminotransferase class I/II-fold pyridoxal phosphate-dependent enzyme [Candidatus Baltobacteraceae bacterium]
MLAQFRLEAFFAEWEFKARYHLTASDAETMSVAELLTFADAADRARWETLRLGYIDTRGTSELRDAVANTYERVSADDILCFAGAEEGMYCAMRGLLEPGDHAIVLVPNYQSMESIPRATCDVTGVSLHAEAGWKLDIEDVRRALRPNTKMVAVNFPNNPTGAISSREAFAQLVELCAQRGIYLFSDEVYRGVERDADRRLPQAADLYDRALSLNVVSKAYGLPGLRVGWIASRDSDALNRMAELKHYLSICNSAPSEVLATIAVKAQARIFERTRALVTENLAKLGAFFARHADRFEWYEPDGGCVAFPRYTGPEGAQTFCRALLEREGVLLLPASLYQSDLLAVAHDRFRIGFGRKGIDEALAAFERFL